MPAYGNIDEKTAGLKQGLDSRVASRRSAMVDGIDFGYPTFRFAGNEKDAFMYRNNRAQIVWDGDFEASNDIDITVDGTAVTTVPFNATQAQTVTDLVAQIEADIAGASAEATDTGGDNRTITITIEDGVNRLVTEEVTGGSGQPDGTITYDSTMVFDGIAMFTQKESAQVVDADGNVVEAAEALYAEKEAANIMINGWITGVTADAVVSTSDGYVIIAAGADQGKLTDTASGNVALSGVTFDEDVAAAGLAIIRVNK